MHGASFPERSHGSGQMLSVVLPVHNEEGNIGRLVREIVEVFETTIKRPFEIIIVDDASTDRSVEAAGNAEHEIAESGSMAVLKIIRRRNRQGQSASLMRGIEAAAGSLIVTMDADLQHDPADIPRLLEIAAGCDMVCGIRKSRSDGTIRGFCSKVANVFRNIVTYDNTADSGCTFRVMHKSCVPVIRSFQGRLYGCEFFFHPAILRRQGFRVSQCLITHRERGAGKSRYRLMKGRLVTGIFACFQARKFLDMRK